MGRFLTSQDFVEQFGEDEARQIAGSGDWNTPEGSVIDPVVIEAEIAFADELVGGYVLGRHPWLADQAVADVPNLVKRLAGDIVRYRLRDKPNTAAQITETVQARYAEALKLLERIQRGTLDLVRDRRDGAELAPAELPGAPAESAAIAGSPPRAGIVLEGY